MSPDEQKQQFSFAYVRAVASVAGIAVSQPDVDDDSIDLMFQMRGGGGTVRSPRLEAQVKCTERDILTDSQLRYPLRVKNYDDLRTTDVMVPRILIVVIVPKELNEWLIFSEEELILRQCGYWHSLRGEQAVTNTDSVTVYPLRANLFSVDQLTAIFERLRNRDLP